MTIGVAPDYAAAETLWPELERAYLSLTDKRPFRGADFESPRRPESTPWCAAVILLGGLDLGWIADFERCLAWAWIEQINLD